LTKISRRLRTDKKALAIIEAEVHKTKVYLTYNNMVVKLTRVEAERIANILWQAVNIQDSDKRKAL